MSSSRTKAFAKLFFLLGLPILLLVGLFAGGVYVGAVNRGAILSFEKRWLGMDVVVPVDTAKEGAGAWIDALAAKVREEAGAAKPTAMKPTPTEPTPTPTETKPTETKPTETRPTETRPTETTPTETKPTPPARSLLDPPVRPAMPLTLVLPEPLPGELEAIKRDLATVKVKVFVDPAWAEKAADPFAYVQQTVAWASQIYETQIGLRLELQSIARWEDAPRGLPAKLGGLCDLPRDGADLLLGFASEMAGAEEAIADARCAIVPQSPRSHQAPHLRSMLYVVGRLLGAERISDPGSEAWRSNSWMGDVLADDAQSLWIDAASREAMLRGKQSAPWRAAAGSGADAGATREEAE
ncbi:MAG: hypothetical protein R3A79_07360 [Nannocystaceae bacterium]